MARLHAGQYVRVAGKKRTADPLSIPVGVVSKILCVWDDQDYPIELDGFFECLRADEVKLTSRRPK